MNNLIAINNQTLQVKEYRGQRVVTMKEIDAVHERPAGTARKRFNGNKQHFVEGVDYFTLNQPSEIRTLDIKRPQGGVPEVVSLITESGYLMLVKSFTDDLAWQVQRQLVNSYFRVSEADNTALLKVQAQKERAHAMLMNAKTRALQTLMKTHDNKNLSHIALEVYGLKSIESIMGQSLGQFLPETDATYSATDLANEFGVTANKIGRLASAANLKTPEYGITVLDKSPYSAKEVSSFRYNEKGREKMKRLLTATA